MSGTGTAKIIEKHHGRAFVQGVQSVQIQLPIPGPAGPQQPGPVVPPQRPGGLPGLPGGAPMNREQRRQQRKKK